MSSDASLTSASAAGGLALPPSGPERLSVAACHGAILIGVPFVLPLAIWLLFPLMQPPSPYVRSQALQALMFHVFILLTSGVAGALAAAFWFLFLIGWPFAAFFGLISLGLIVWGSWYSLIAMIRGFQGRPYRLPVVGGWSV